MSSTGIIILQYGHPELTCDCVRSILRVNTAPVKLIIVDNGSPDPAACTEVEVMLRELFGESLLVTDDNPPAGLAALPAATFVRSATNDGYARGNNKGLALAYRDPGIDSLLILNNDILFVDDIIPVLAHDAATVPSGALFSPLLVKPGTMEIDVNCARHPLRYKDLVVINTLILRYTDSIRRRCYIPMTADSGLQPAELISGGCMFCRKDLFQSLGAFDPGTFLFFEENILWEQIRRRGLKNYVDTTTRCIHLGSSTIARRPSLFITRSTIRSQRHFAFNYLGLNPFQKAILRLSELWVLGIVNLRNLFRR